VSEYKGTLVIKQVTEAWIGEGLQVRAVSVQRTPDGDFHLEFASDIFLSEDEVQDLARFLSSVSLP